MWPLELRQARPTGRLCSVGELERGLGDFPSMKELGWIQGSVKSPAQLQPSLGEAQGGLELLLLLGQLHLELGDLSLQLGDLVMEVCGVSFQLPAGLLQLLALLLLSSQAF